MAKLDCDVVNCTYNKDASCVRKNIGVEGDTARYASETCCGSFEVKRKGCCSNAMSEDAAKDTDVNCGAVECKFNQNHKCSANHIGISGKYADDMSETECASFII